MIFRDESVMSLIQNSYTIVDFVMLPYKKRPNIMIFLPGNDNMVDNIFTYEKIRDYELYPETTICYRKGAHHGSIIGSAKFDTERRLVVNFLQS